jgi:hypothetical protein
MRLTPSTAVASGGGFGLSLDGDYRNGRRGSRGGVAKQFTSAGGANGAFSASEAKVEAAAQLLANSNFDLRHFGVEGDGGGGGGGGDGGGSNVGAGMGEVGIDDGKLIDSLNSKEAAANFDSGSMLDAGSMLDPSMASAFYSSSTFSQQELERQNLFNRASITEQEKALMRRAYLAGTQVTIGSSADGDEGDGGSATSFPLSATLSSSPSAPMAALGGATAAAAAAASGRRIRRVQEQGVQEQGQGVQEQEQGVQEQGLQSMSADAQHDSMDGLHSLSMDEKISIDEHMSLHGSFKMDADDIFAGVLDAAAAAAVGTCAGIVSAGIDQETMSSSLLSMSLDDESSSSLRGVMAAAAAAVPRGLDSSTQGEVGACV